MSTGERPDFSAIYADLKDFQRQTVDYVFRRLYTDADFTRRFLVADEVGLGKTKVAQGVVARAIEHLWDRVGRIDVVYICSNASIAEQNINRLHVPVPGQEPFQRASRVTLLPITVRELNNNRLNFVSFTPTTSFRLASSLGTRGERTLLYWLLDRAWGLSGRGPRNVLQGNAGKDRFRDEVDAFDPGQIDAQLAERFARDLAAHDAAERAAGRPDLRSRFAELCDRFHYARRHIPDADQRDRARWIGEVRTLLAATCLHALEPDLIILDEFQRFKDLLTGEGDASRLAQSLFNYADDVSSARVLLLSATPYKMYTLPEEAGSDDHYQDFFATLRFLDGESGRSAPVAGLLQEYRRALYHLASDIEGARSRLRQLKAGLEAHLRRVMVRTERLAVSADRSGMLRHVPVAAARLEPADLHGYLAVQAVAAAVDHGDMVRYWKAAPYLLNFMDEYELKRAMRDGLDFPEVAAAVRRALQRYPQALLPWRDWAGYRAIDPGNPRLRHLMHDMVESGLWRLLWLPPSLPYYRLAGPYAEPGVQGCTKRLLFSAWRVVPKATAALLSYEVERRLIGLFEANPENTPEARKRRRPLLRFARTDGRLTGMPVLALLYPSTTLAAAADPLRIAAALTEASGESPALSDVLRVAEGRMAKLLAELPAPDPGGPVDEDWYWAAPILLDLQRDGEATRRWFEDTELAGEWADGESDDEDEEPSRWSDHVERARDIVAGRLKLGQRPPDLGAVLALLAVAGPAVVALRSLERQAGDAPADSGLALTRRLGAGQVAWRLRGLFNLPESMSLLRGLNRQEPYWRRVLEYCADGCLQAVLDEYAHMLVEVESLRQREPAEAAREVADCMIDALSLRSAALLADDLQVQGSEVRIEKQSMRTRYAVRLSDEQGEEGQLNRLSQVRSAFNSPFWPFVLASTSIGQEGLDFHPYCHAVVHWDLPPNPVDMEQREGRVHRYKGHAVRKNLAARYGSSLLASAGGGDVWEALFEAARRDREPDASDLVPYWVYPGEAQIERHVPMLPLSQDLERMAALQRALALYRMVFGQPRQEDAVAYLLTYLPAELVERLQGELQIDLSPPGGAV